MPKWGDWTKASAVKVTNCNISLTWTWESNQILCCENTWWRWILHLNNCINFFNDVVQYHYQRLSFNYYFLLPKLYCEYTLSKYIGLIKFKISINRYCFGIVGINNKPRTLVIYSTSAIGLRWPFDLSI